MATTYEPIEYDPTKYEVDTNDARLTAVDKEVAGMEAEADKQYGERVAGIEEAYGGLRDSVDKWKETQTDIQNQQTEHTIQQIEQQKEYAQKDYQREQAGAYVDWRKQSNQYGAEAEKMAASGLANTGYSESSQVSMYNAYQNRVAVARESFQRTCDNFANQINEAKLQNNAALAEIAQTALEKSAEYILQETLQKDQLLSELFNQKMQIKQYGSDKWFKVYDQLQAAEDREYGWDMQQEQNAFTASENEKDRVANEKLQIKLREIDQAHDEKMAALEQQYKLDYLNAETEAEKKILKEQYEYDKKIMAQELADAKEKAKHQADLELANDKELLRYQNSLTTTSFSGGGGGSTTTAYKQAQSEKFATKKANKSAVSTAYYQGSKNADASKYGTFSNGYQPKGISGHGKLTSSGKTITVSTVVQYGTDKGKKQNLVQTVWKAEDGTKWYWEGRQNKYIQIK